MKILLVFDNNILLKNSGTKMRIFNIFSNLKDIEIDQFAVLRGERELEKPLECNNLIKNVFLGYKFKKTIGYRIKREAKRFFKQIGFNIELPIPLEINFKNALKNHYDYIVFVRNSFDGLLKHIPLETTKVCFVEDFVTLNNFQQEGHFDKIGLDFQRELSFYSQMDKLVFISHKEQEFFEQFLKVKSYYVPYFRDDCFTEHEAKYDICYNASDNIHNIRSINWFLKKVYPLLPRKTKFLFVGKICSKIKHKESYKNIEFVDFIEDLGKIYKNSKIAICPMLSGTGLKIKVIDALSYGKPIVCTKLGIDGMKETEDNGCLVADEPQEFVKYIKKLLEDYHFYNTVADYGAEFFMDNFSTEKNFKQLNKIFRKKTKKYVPSSHSSNECTNCFVCGESTTFTTIYKNKKGKRNDKKNKKKV